MAVVQPNTTLTTALLQALIAADRNKIMWHGAVTSRRQQETGRRNQETFAAINQYNIMKGLTPPNTPIGDAAALHPSLDKMAELSGIDPITTNPAFGSLVVNPTTQEDQLNQWVAGTTLNRFEESGLTDQDLERNKNYKLFGQGVTNVEMQVPSIFAEMVNDKFKWVQEQDPGFGMQYIRGLAGLSPDDLEVPGVPFTGTNEEITAWVRLHTAGLVASSSGQGDLFKNRMSEAENLQVVLEKSYDLTVPAVSLMPMIAALKSGSMTDENGQINWVLWQEAFGPGFDAVPMAMSATTVIRDEIGRNMLLSMGPAGQAIYGMIQQAEMVAAGRPKEEVADYQEDLSKAIDAYIDTVADTDTNLATALRAAYPLSYRTGLSSPFSRDIQIGGIEEPGRGVNPAPGRPPQAETWSDSDARIGQAYNRIFRGEISWNDAIGTLTPSEVITLQMMFGDTKDQLPGGELPEGMLPNAVVPPQPGELR